MPFKRNRNGSKKTKYVTKRGLPFQLMKYAETKYSTATSGAPGVDLLLPSPATITNLITLTDIRQGDNFNERDGMMIQITGVYIRIIYEAALTGAAQYLRAILYSPRISSSFLAPASDMVNIIDPEQFIVWSDKTVLCPQNPGNGHGVLTIRKKFKPYMKALYDTDIGGSQTKGTLRLLLLGKINNGTSVQFNARVYFKDL